MGPEKVPQRPIGLSVGEDTSQWSKDTRCDLGTGLATLHSTTLVPRQTNDKHRWIDVPLASAIGFQSRNDPSPRTNWC